MAVQTNYYKIGVFVLTGVGILVGFLILLGLGSFFEETVYVETYFDESVQGLEVGSSLRYRGVKIGEVSNIGLVSDIYPEALQTDNDRMIFVRAALTELDSSEHTIRDFDRRLIFKVDEGMRVRLQSSGITGLSFLQVDFVDPKNFAKPFEPPWQPRWRYLPSAPSNLTRITESLSNVTAKLNEADLVGIANQTQQFLKNANQSIKDAPVQALGQKGVELIEELRATNQQIRKFATDPEIMDIVRHSTKVAERTNGLIERAEPKVTKLLDDLVTVSDVLTKTAREMDLLLADVRANQENEESVFETLPRSIQRFENTLFRVESMLGQQQEALDQVMQNLVAVTANLKDLTATAKKHPSLLLFGEPPESPAPAE
jgi:ABC-type transporter Mla subunit MlaD